MSIGAGVSTVADCEGIYDDIPDHVYHADTGSLSSSGARALLRCPARFRWDQDHPPDPTDAFDLGHAAHTVILGAGAPIAEIDAGDWRTKTARQAREQARADRKMPLLKAQAEQVRVMAAAVRDHPIAAVLFAEGAAEQSAYLIDDATGVWLRARPDWLTVRGGLTLCVDYKTTNCADPDKFAKSVADYGYHQQQAWYVDVLVGLGLAEHVEFLFVVQEKTPPYLVSVCCLDDDAVALGRNLNRQAIDTYAECLADGIWPGYGDDIHQISLPAWATR